MSELIDRQALLDEIWKMRMNYQMMDDTHTADKIMHGLYRAEQAVKEAPTIAASPWHRVTDAIFYEDKPPDKKTDAIFYYEWTGISGTVYRETSIISLNELMALGCRPIAWMEKPEPPKEDAR